MKARDPDVVQTFYGVPHKLGRDRRLFGDRQIRGAGCRHHDRALARRDVTLTERNHRCIGIIRCARDGGADRVELRRGGARHDQCRTAADDFPGDRSGLGRCFA